MSLRLSVAVLALLSGCRREPDGVSSVDEVDQPARAPITVTPVGSGAGAPVTPAAPPPGTDKLVRVPADVAAKIEIREVVRGLARPVALVVAPGDARRRMFIPEQHTGKIRVFENGALSAKTFFTIKDISTGAEQGLLGLAFHPKFATNRKLYINYTERSGASNIVEYQVSATDPDVVDTATRKPIIKVAQPYSNHNGGHVLFGPDGKLYAGFGDGGAAGDPKRNGQNPTALLAKMLRIDVDAAKPTTEILHIGLRNPWRYAFDVKSGGLYIGDVGQNAWEYVFVVPIDSPRRNFGWNIVEGSHCYKAQTCDRSGFTPPAAEYAHDQGCSITGGAVYRGKALPVLEGRYFYADYCTGLLRSFVWTADPSSPTSPGFTREHWDWKPTIDRKAVLAQISSFGVDHDGELYIVELTGVIYKLAPKGN